MSPVRQEKIEVEILGTRLLGNETSVNFAREILLMTSLPSSTFCSLQYVVCSLQSAVCSLRSAVCSLQSANVRHRPANNPSSSSPNLLYKLKITCCGRWRRVIVPANFSLYALHIVIQEIFGWESYHLHHFMWKDKEYSLGENYDEERIPEGNSHVHQRSYMYYASPQELLDERVYKLYNVFSGEKRVLEYEYDFGASWSLKIQFEGTVAEDPAQNGEYPLCVDGRGANRKEDCQDEDSDGELLPSFKNKKFSRQETQRNLRKVFAGKWPLKVDNTTLEKCYTCAWFKKRGGCRASSCDGKCCGVCLKSKFIRESAVQ